MIDFELIGKLTETELNTNGNGGSSTFDVLLSTLEPKMYKLRSIHTLWYALSQYYDIQYV